MSFDPVGWASPVTTGVGVAVGAPVGDDAGASVGGAVGDDEGAVLDEQAATPRTVNRATTGRRVRFDMRPGTPLVGSRFRSTSVDRARDLDKRAYCPRYKPARLIRPSPPSAPPPKRRPRRQCRRGIGVGSYGGPWGVPGSHAHVSRLQRRVRVLV